MAALPAHVSRRSRAAGPTLLIASLLAAACLSACTTWPAERHIGLTLSAPEMAGTRWGVMAATLDGRTVFATREDDRYLPASNTKLFITAAAFNRLRDPAIPDLTYATSLRLTPGADGGPPDLILTGGGDATLSDRADCTANCLDMLVEVVIQNRIERVRNIIGDDTLFPDERWGPGWSWNNLQTRSGTAISALTVNDNEIALQIAARAEVGAPAIAVWRDGDDLFPLVNEVATIAAGETDVRLEYLPGASAYRVYGQIAPGSPVVTQTAGIGDPAYAAALRFRRRLEAAGVAVEGEVQSRRRPLGLADDPRARTGRPAPAARLDGIEIGRLLPPPLLGDLFHITKVSQNLHAEILLRRLGLLDGGGSAADGLAVVQAMLDEAEIAGGVELFDGSGMSTYNRISPRAMVRFLTWTASQPWGEAWRETLPVGGVDGSLARRFKGTALEGRIFAKTGTLNATNALSGFLVAASGQTLAFSAYANDRPSTAPSAILAMDTAILAIAAAN